MKLKNSGVFFIFSLLLLSAAVTAENDDNTWNKKRAAVALTYDDALNIHLDSVVPALDKKGFKGTFYITASVEPFVKRIKEWRAISANGHELGNHTLFHPCLGGAGREWLDPKKDLSQWSLDRFLDNLKVTNAMLEAVDGKVDRTFAYPCGDTEVGTPKVSYIESLKELVVAARSVGGDLQTQDQLRSNLYAINSQTVLDDTGKKLIGFVDDAIEQGALVVFLFHGVGGEHNLNVSTAAHAELLTYLQEKQKEVWVAPLIAIVEHVKQNDR